MSWPHIHLALNHVPVLGTLFVAILFVTALVRKQNDWVRLSLLAFVILTGVAIPIKFTGDFANESLVEANVNWLDADLVAAHEQSADQATTGIFLLGIVALIGWFVSRGGKSIPKWAIIATLIAALATTLLMARAANLGGQLRHTEIRE